MKQKKPLIGALGVVVVLGLLYFIYQHFTYVSTDNAQVGAHVTLLSSRVNGTIQKVFVNENQAVKAGEVLAQIDTADYSNATQTAVAQLSSLEARMKEADVNYQRAKSLFAEQAISRERVEAAEASFKDLTAKWRAAKAQAEQANLNFSYTRILAPSDGFIAKRSLEPGQFVTVGQPLFGFVDNEERWITANLKETEIGQVSVGKVAQVEVDAINGKKFQGEVESIGPSTGSMFALLPPDNATGNFTKVVQRVPVRIKLLQLSAQDKQELRAGLSALVSIKIR